MEWRKGIWVVVTALVVQGGARADMIHGPEWAFECPVADAVCSSPDPQPFGDGGLSVCPPVAADADSLWAGLLAEPEVDVDGLSEPTAASWILSDRQNSFDLCLYTLLGLGLCKSAPRMKRLSLGVIPGWYYDGRPFQVGNSYALSPDGLCSSLVCFVQPGLHPASLPAEQIEVFTAASWRAARPAPIVHGSTGPPSPSL